MFIGEYNRELRPLSVVKTQRASSSTKSKHAPSEIQFRKGIINKIQEYADREDKGKHAAVNVLLY